MSYLEQMRPPQGLKVLVTAGASGIGAVIALAFAEMGAQVMICDVDEAALARCSENQPSIHPVKTDVSDSAAVERMFVKVRSTLGGLDVLVNNAGIAGPTGAIDDLALADIESTLDINLMSQFAIIRQAAPLLRASQTPSIINISTVAGRLGYAMRTPYAASKWAIVGLTNSLAKEMGPDGVRVNAILPGIVEGPRMDKVIQARADSEAVSFEEMRETYLKNISLRRMVKPEDIASMALFLCSPAGGNISGQAISVCGNVETI